MLGLSTGLAVVAVACAQEANPILGSTSLNSRYTDEQPGLSGNGRLLAMVSNRGGDRNILLYDLQRQQLINLPRLNRRDAIAENPSLSYTGRYLVYVASDRGRPEIELYDRIIQRTQVLTVGYRGWIRNPSISPDGRYIVFESGSRGQWDIEVLDRGANVELDIPDGSRSIPYSISPP
jgi:Tol biopolymer transport system component